MQRRGHSANSGSLGSERTEERSKKLRSITHGAERRGGDEIDGLTEAILPAAEIAPTVRVDCLRAFLNMAACSGSFVR